MQLRPRLRRCYITVCDLASYGPAAHQLGFRQIERASAPIDGLMHHLAVLDFGPNSVDGWLGDLVARELGEEPAPLLDADTRELVLGGERVALTPLELGVLRHLSQQEGRAVPRTELLERVWGQTYGGGSNVVDVVVRSLRKKLGDRASLLVTVRGFGYRFRGTAEAAKAENVPALKGRTAIS
jgi:DNA-binding winged helix-turn-helix (wHTH) protein